ncbi:uncharacterized protein SCHCODRAFT_01157792 [Schizophyllum commune H4-8]|nr:uncharacterized protein SCHCODRAFT_01157792 [Schizophyllum commune H4-8]KAI5889396.1 hypothetical protein SCHCODRAFT_01157792 [Schizophyllum commune H4-8]
MTTLTSTITSTNTTATFTTFTRSAAAMPLDELGPPPPFSATPSYSTLPLDNEQRLEYTPRARDSTYSDDRNGTYARRWRSAIIALSGQASNALLPVYGRAEVVEGELCLTERAGVQRIVVELEGVMTTALTNNGRTETVLVQRRHIAWDGPGSNGGSDMSECPSSVIECPGSIAFAVQFPQSYVDKKDGNRRRALPPTFEASFYQLPVLTASCAYTLRVTVTRARKRRSLIGSGERAKTYELPLLYRPRHRPHRPYTVGGSLFSTLKSQPDEWLQVTKTMEAKGEKGLSPLFCNLFVPSMQIFCIKDSIPLHLQISGPVTSFREFMPEACRAAGDELEGDTSVTPTDSPRTRRASLILDPTRVHDVLHPRHKQNVAAPVARPTIRVSIMRQVFAEVNGTKTWRMLTIGAGKVTQVLPPPYDECCALDESIAVDWEGEVRCDDSVSAAGFNNGHLSVTARLSSVVDTASD